MPRSFIDEHQGPVGSWGCSGTLIGDGLLITVGHCSPSTVTFNHQLAPDLTERSTTSFGRAEVVELDTDIDYRLVRLHYSPENFFGMTGIDDRTMTPDEKIVVIGHPYQLNHPTNANGSTYKVVDVGRVQQATTGNILYKQMDTRGGLSGAGVLAADTGYLVGFHRAGPDDQTCSQDTVQGRANPITRVFPVSSVINGDRGTGHFLKNYGYGSDDPYMTQLTTVNGWGSRWHHIVPGRFNDNSLDDLFFYDSTAGTGRFYYVNSSRTITGIGPTLTGLRKTWSLISPIDLDGTGTTELLFYDARDGFGAFYRTDGVGGLSEIRHDSSWGHNWDQIVSGNLIPSTSERELVFFSRSLGLFRVYRTNTNGTIAKVGDNNSTIAPTVLLAGDFEPDPAGRQELFAYVGPTRTGYVLSFSTAGVMSVVRSQTLPAYYSQITAGDFMASPGTELLAYEPSTGNMVVYRPYAGTLAPVSTQSGLRENMGKVISANFMGSDGYETLAYDRFRTADQACNTGIASDNVCCEAACGSCGGSDCSGRPGGKEACCAGTIRNAGVSCTESGPPCVLSDPQCVSGILEGGVCCDDACGACGGEGCSGRPGGSANCCAVTIEAEGRSCAEYPPPCVMP
ncbi:MAG TPA: serine protease [Polyangiaceae bacterium]|nr:serine protease [Polyangiaceae bacterium]